MIYLLQEGATSFVHAPGDIGVESTIVSLVLWLKLAVEMVGAVVIGIGVAAAVYKFLRSLVPPGLEGYNEIRLTLASLRSRSNFNSGLIFSQPRLRLHGIRSESSPRLP